MVTQAYRELDGSIWMIWNISPNSCKLCRTDYNIPERDKVVLLCHLLVMYKYGKELEARLGGVDITVTLFKCIRRDEIEKTHLHGLASVLGLLPTYKAYKDRDPFDEKVAVTLLSELLDKVILTTRSE